MKEVRDDVDAGYGNGAPPMLRLRLPARKGEVSGDILKGAGVGAELVVGVGGVGGAGEAALGGRRGDPDQLLRVWEGQRAEQQGVDDAEDGDVGADAEGKDEDGDER